MAKVNIIKHLTDHYTSKERGEILKEFELPAAAYLILSGMLKDKTGLDCKIIEIDCHVTTKERD